MMKKRNTISAIIIFFGLLALLLWLYVKVIEFGQRIEATTSIYLVYGYYVVVALLVLYFILRPFFIIFLSPSYSLTKIHRFNDEKITQKKMKDNYQEMRKMANKLMQKQLVKERNVDLLKTELNNQETDFEKKYNALKTVLNKIIKDDLRGDIRRIIVLTARDTMYFTSISQNGLADILIVLVNNFRLIKKIVTRCGFRPTFTKLLRLYFNVTIACFVADGAQSVDIGSILGNSLKGLAKPFVGSLINGTVNSFFMLRAGFLTRSLIFEEHDTESKEINLLKTSYAEAAAALPELTVASFIDPIINIFKGTFVTPTKQIVRKVFHQESPYPNDEGEEPAK